MQEIHVILVEQDPKPIYPVFMFALRVLYAWLFISLVLYGHISVFCSPPKPGFTYSKADSLRQLLTHSLADSIKVDLYCKLSHEVEDWSVDSAISCVQLAIEKCTSNKLRKVNELNHLSSLFMAKGDFKSALFYYLQALRISDASNLKKGKFVTLTNIGVLFYNLKKIKEAKKYFILSKQIAEKDFPDNHFYLSSVYTNLGNIASDEDSLSVALRYYYKGLLISTDKGSKYITMGNIGETYYDLNMLDSAEHYLRAAVDLGIDDLDILTFVLIVYAKVAEKEARYKDAIQRLIMADDLLTKAGMVGRKEEIMSELAKIYAILGKHRLAYHYLERAKSIKDSTVNQNTMAQMAELQKAYEVDKRDKEIQLLNQKEATLRAETGSERMLRNSAIIILVSVLIVTLVMVRNLVLKQKVKTNLLNQEKAKIEHDNIKLSRENTEARYENLKNRINPHFLFNNLNTLSSIVTSDPDSAVEYIERFSELYRLILKTGRQPMIGLEEEMLTVKNYLFLQQMEFGDKLETEIRIPAELYYYFVPPFAMQMVIENAIKHNIIGRTRHLKIQITSEKEWIVVSNNLQRKNSQVLSTRTGQKSITDRYALLTDKVPEFSQTETSYRVKLPLLTRQSISPSKDLQAMGFNLS